MVNGGPRGGFAIRHYAAEVIYDVDGWLDKNKDSLTAEAYTVSHPRWLSRGFFVSNKVACAIN